MIDNRGARGLTATASDRSASTVRTVCGRRVKYVIIVFWLLALAVATPLSSKLPGAEKNETKQWLPASAESTKVLDVQASFGGPDTAPAVIVYERASGLTAADKAKIAGDARTFAQRPELDGTVIGPVPSADGQAMQLIVPIDLGPDWERWADLAGGLRDIASSDDPGLAAHVTGPTGNIGDQADALSGIDGMLLYGTISVVVLILLLTYRSPVLWLLPVICAGIALTCTQAVIYLLAKNEGLTANANTVGVLTVLVFGAGTDYALLLVARYREELRRHPDRHQAMAVALRRAAPAIIASAATVAIGMLCLSIAEMNSTKGLGPVLAIGITVGLLVMLTLLPALLVTVGRWVFWPVRPRYGSAEPSTSGVWARMGAGVARHPRRIWIGTTLVLGSMAVGAVQLNATGLSLEDAFRTRPDSVVGAGVLARHFPAAAGSGSPVVVVSDAAQVHEVRSAFAGTQGIVASSVTEPRVRSGQAYLEGTLVSAADSRAAYDTVDRARASVQAVPGAHAMVGGTSAITHDVQDSSGRDSKRIIPIVLVIVFVILALLLRALTAPVILLATVMLSFGAALGVSALVFRHLFHFHGADPSMPLYVFVYLVALGIDYNIFLMTRVREEAQHQDTRVAARVGLAATGGVITSAGLVLAGTFSVLATLPLTTFTEIGFAVAFGVLLDTVVVRSILVTALNLDIGDRIWWPSRLSHR